jgi:hypothetical protein
MKIFLIGGLIALLPSVLAVLWLMWRSSSWPGVRTVQQTLRPHTLER